MKTNLAVFPGTFDPLTLGHYDLIRRASRLFDRVLVAVAESPSKHTLLDFNARIASAAECVKDLENVEVVGFSGMLVDFLHAHKADVLIRGVRTVADYDYEMQLTGMYRMIMPDMEIVMLPSSGDLAFISSTLVREVIIHQGDISKFVPPAVAEAVNRLFPKK